MDAPTKTRRALLLTNVAHYLTAMVVFLKGADKVSIPGKELFGGIFIVISLIILFGTLLHHRLERLLRHFKAWVMGLEAIAIAIVGYLYLKEGKELIQYVCFAASLMFILAVIIYFRKNRNAGPVTHS